MNYQPALLVAVGMWLGRNATYAQSNKNGRDWAVTTFSASVADTDPEGARTWAMTFRMGDFSSLRYARLSPTG